MPVKQLFLSLFILSLLISCKKGDNRSYSKWYVGTDSFSTNNVTVEIGKAITIMASHDERYRFGFFFERGGGLPNNEAIYLIGKPTTSSSQVNAGFLANGKNYTPTPSSITIIHPQPVDGKIQ